MRISDWSSDVCSSDLGEVHAVGTPALVVVGAALHDRDRTAGEAAERQAAAVAGDRRLGKARQVGVAQGDRLLHRLRDPGKRSEEHTSELQSLMRISYAVFCLKKKNTLNKTNLQII